MIPLRPTWALCLALGCLALSSGCVRVASEGPDGANPPPETTLSTTPQPATATNAKTLVGTAADDNLRAGDGDDVVRGLGGDDEIHGGEGKDRLYGGPGDDVIDAQDPRSVGRAGRDEIFCGPGRDEVLMDANDGERPRDCEMATVGTS